MSVDEVKANGWTAVPVSASEIVKGRGQLSPPAAITVHDVYFPSDDLLVAEAQQFAKKRFSVETYNHSMRVFYWGNAIGKQLLPELTGSLSPVTWALACLLHDIGAAETYFASTRMSFDIYGGIKAMEVLKILGSTHDQAEAVAEAIIRHQDLGVDGTITFIGQLIQLATIYDNVGEYEGIEDFGSLVHEATRDEVNKAFPRLHWSNCFAETVRREESSKPWCHTTHIPQFEEKIKANALHKKWE